VDNSLKTNYMEEISTTTEKDLSTTTVDIKEPVLEPEIIIDDTELMMLTYVDSEAITTSTDILTPSLIYSQLKIFYRYISNDL